MSSPSPRAELIAIQKKLWRHNNQIIDSSILVKEPDFARYEAAYRRAVKSYERIADQDEMLRAVRSSDIVYVGDYHTCNQSQRSFLRILKAVVKQDRDFAVGLELLHKRHQPTLDAYLAGRITEHTFLARIKLQEHWIFDLWSNFKPLFDFCKYHRIPMYALEAAPRGADLYARDMATAKLIARAHSMHPARRFFVFIGDLHIAPAHLPACVTQELARYGSAARELILYENSESIYWKLAARGLDDSVEVVRIDARSFCRMHTPPVVCQRSYLNWLEHEEGEIDYSDAKHEFLEVVDRLCEFLHIDLGAERDNVEVYTCGDVSFLRELGAAGRCTPREIKTIKEQMLAGESCYIAKARIVYLANLSINHAAEEAAHFIKNVASGPEQPRELIDAVYANILHEALGFFGSKLINHKRKCNHERDFKNLVTFLETIDVPADRTLEYEAARLVLEFKNYERRHKELPRADAFRSRMDLFVAVTHALGYMLGDRMYYGLMTRTLSRRLISDLFLDPWREEGAAYATYMVLIKKLKGVAIPKRM